MAQFYGTLRGQRDTVATKCGTKDSGVRATASGWNIGAVAYASHFTRGGGDAAGDAVTIGIDGGSNGSRDTITFLTVDERDTIPEIVAKLRSIADHMERHTYHGWPT